MEQRILSVLIVDDEKLERVLLRNAYDWASHGFEIAGEAGSAREALDFLTQTEVDLVLTDINMPQMDGLAFVEEASSRFPYYETQYVIITGYRDFEYARQAVKLGVKEFLLKPVDFCELEKTVLRLRSCVLKNENERKILSQLRRILETDSAGGKELFFKTIAGYSTREALSAEDTSDFTAAPGSGTGVYLGESGAASQFVLPKDFAWDDFIFSIEQSLDNKIHEFVVSFADWMQRSCAGDPYLLKLSAVYFLSKAEQPLLKAGSSFAEAPEFSGLWQQIDSVYTADDAKAVLEAAVQKVCSLCRTSRPKVLNTLTEKALQIINEYIFDPELSLPFVAERAFVNPSYLSRLFKQDTGETFSSYILAQRMQEAIRLITTTDAKVYEIAERVGILDPHYFSLCFKRFTGINVTDYRSR